MRGLVFALAILLPQQAWAFCRSTTCRGPDCTKDNKGCPNTGEPLFWKTRCIGYALNKNLTQNLDHEEARDALTKAFQAWSEIDCGSGKFSSLTFSPMEDVACRRTQFNQGGANINVVFFQDDDWQYRDIDNTLAKTTVSFNPDTGEIYDADIEINTSANKVTVGTEGATYDLQSIMTHEVGHLIGIAHSNKSTATMYASYEPGTFDLRDLDEDDKAAACAIYPPDREATCDSTPIGGVGDTCDTPSCNALPMPSIIVLAVYFLLRRRW